MLLSLFLLSFIYNLSGLSGLGFCIFSSGISMNFVYLMNSTPKQLVFCMFYVGSLHEKENDLKPCNWRFQNCMCTHES